MHHDVRRVSPTRRALVISAAYLFIALPWVAFSDALLTRVISDPAWQTAALSWKGVGFALFTAVFMFLLVRRSGQDLVRSHHAARRASRDELTGLPGRHSLHLILCDLMRRATHHGESMAVIVLGVNGLRRINHALGTSAADTLLVQMAQRLQQVRQANLVMARPGGGYFVLGVAPPCSAEQALGEAKLLRNLLQEPYEVAGMRLDVTVSAGVATFPEEADNPDALVRVAEMAMVQARDQDLGVTRFQRSSPRHRDSLSLELDLRRALGNGEFELFYQPLMATTGERIVGAEALLRWRHPRHGLIPPVDFVPLLEQSGDIVTVGEWVLHEACRRAAGWPDDCYVSVNVSRRQLGNPALPQQVRAALAGAGLPPHRLVLEITESLAMRDPAETQGRLQALKHLGVTLAMDDFGTGYSSLAYLRRFPLDVIKIDRLFIQGIPEDRDNDTLVRTIIEMAHSLGRRVIAEGVEHRAEMERLRALGCETAQGYYYARPMPLADFQRFVREYTTLTL